MNSLGAALSSSGNPASIILSIIKFEGDSLWLISTKPSTKEVPFLRHHLWVGLLGYIPPAILSSGGAWPKSNSLQSCSVITVSVVSIQFQNYPRIGQVSYKWLLSVAGYGNNSISKESFSTSSDHAPHRSLYSSSLRFKSNKFVFRICELL